MRAAKIGTAVLLATGLWTTTALADETAKPAKGTMTLETTKITLRAPRPAVAIDVARVIQRAPSRTCASLSSIASARPSTARLFDPTA